MLTSLGVTDQTQRVSGFDPGAAGQSPDDRWVDGRVSLKGELFQPFWAGKARVADAPFGATSGAVVAFGDHQLREEPEVGQLFAFGRGADLGEPVADGG